MKTKTQNQKLPVDYYERETVLDLELSKHTYLKRLAKRHGQNIFGDPSFVTSDVLAYYKYRHLAIEISHGYSSFSKAGLAGVTVKPLPKTKYINYDEELCTLENLMELGGCVFSVEELRSKLDTIRESVDEGAI